MKTFSAIMISLVLVSCPTDLFNFDAFNYKLDDLVLGVAFPPLQEPSQIMFTIDACNDLDITWVRHQESWVNREPQEDVFNWGAMDTRITLLHEAGIKILLTLGGHEWPAWLNSTAGHKEANTLDQFREYVAALLTRYAGKIDRIQFGNEWNWEIDTYMAGDEDAFIAYANILYDEVYKLSPGQRPTVVLGSLNGLAYLALDQGLIDRIVIEGREPYKQQIESYIASPNQAVTIRAAKILTQANYDMLDIHLYDDVSNWPAYLSALRNLEQAAGKAKSPVIVSEFGGPYPVDLYGFFGGKPRQAVLANSLVDYIRTLDSMEIEEAYFFSLVEDNERYHRDSYLFTAQKQKTLAYEVMKRFGAANP